MVVGFNHNFRYKGEVYHVQTEDGGLKSPNIVTLLYKAGTILASKKTSYADITKVDRLEQVVEELMKDQHKEMLHRLKNGDFDEVIARHRPAGEGGKAVPPTAAPVETSLAMSEPVAETQSKAASVATSGPANPSPAAETPAEKSPTADLGLDDVILSYLVGGDQN